MTQIPENMRPDSINYKKATPKPEKVETPTLPPTEPKPESPKNLNNNPAAFLGKTQVKKKARYDLSGFNAETVNNMKNDLKFMGENPKLVEKSDKVFNLAYGEALVRGESDPYAKAATVQTEFVNEFENK